MITADGTSYRTEFRGDTAGIASYILSEYVQATDPDDFVGPADNGGHEFYIVRCGRHVVTDSSEEIGEGIGHVRFATIAEAEKAVVELTQFWKDYR